MVSPGPDLATILPVGAGFDPALVNRLLRSFGLDEKTIYQDVEGMEHHISKATLRVLITIVEELERNPKLLQKLREKL
jgi:Mn-dependent DtxR family transcriptional regulator